MKKLLGIGVILLALTFATAVPARACTPPPPPEPTPCPGCTNNFNPNNTVKNNIHNNIHNKNTANASVKNSGNATIGDVTATGGNATAYGGAGGNASATIEKGAVQNTNKNFNTNLNTNKNTNTNTNHQSQGQSQGQLQGQSQSMGDQKNAQTTNVTVEGDDVTVEGDYTPRPFANPGSVAYPGAPEFYGPDSPSSNVMDLRDILSMKNTYDRHVLSVTTKKADMRFRARYMVPTMNKKDRSPDDNVSVYLGKPTAGTMVAMLMVRADDTDTTTFEVMAKAALLALDVKADSLYIVAYNAEKVVKTSGWGVGLGHTTSTMNSAGDIGTVNTGGTGYQKGESGLKGKPWVHAIAVVTP